jgi:general L-amino acid transport system permease protein
MSWLTLHSPKSRRIAWQALAVAAVAGLVGWFTWNALGNFDSRRIGFGMDFLARPANIPIGETLVTYSPGDPMYGAILVGLLNTVLVSLLGILLATVLGAAVGIARLSSNFLASRLAGAYVEYVRNVPLLVHLFFIYIILQGLPPLISAISVADIAFVSNRGLVIPSVDTTAVSAPLLATALILLVGAVLARRLSGRHQSESNLRAKLLSFAATVGFLLSLGMAIYAATAVGLTLPRLQGRSFIGGATISPELAALVLGLTVYYASFIAEIVRGGILSVPKGQWEAAAALGIKRRNALRLVVLPQALRLMIPPTTSQYLDLAKMTSLAIAIGYPDLVTIVNSVITDTGRAIECVAIIMIAFLLINLSISAAMNWVNSRVAPAGRA